MGRFRVGYSSLATRFYAGKMHEKKGCLVCTGYKDDVTDDVKRCMVQYLLDIADGHDEFNDEIKTKIITIDNLRFKITIQALGEEEK